MRVILIEAPDNTPTITDLVAFPERLYLARTSVTCYLSHTTDEYAHTTDEYVRRLFVIDGLVYPYYAVSSLSVENLVINKAIVENGINPVDLASISGAT